MGLDCSKKTSNINILQKYVCFIGEGLQLGSQAYTTLGNSLVPVGYKYHHPMINGFVKRTQSHNTVMSL